jgi:hypothetical protein
MIIIGSIKTIGKNLVAIEIESSSALKVYFFFSKSKIANNIGATAQISQFRLSEYKTAGAKTK